MKVSKKSNDISSQDTKESIETKFLKELQTEYSGFQKGDLVVINPDPWKLNSDELTRSFSIPLEKFRTYLDAYLVGQYSVGEYVAYKTGDYPMIYLGYRIHRAPEDTEVDHFFLHLGQIFVLPSHIQDAIFYLDDDPGGQKTVLKPWFMLANQKEIKI